MSVATFMPTLFHLWQIVWSPHKNKNVCFPEQNDLIRYLCKQAGYYHTYLFFVRRWPLMVKVIMTGAKEEVREQVFKLWKEAEIDWWVTANNRERSTW